MRDSCKQRLYKCSCGTEQKHFTWDSELNKRKHDCINPKCRKKVGKKQLIEQTKVEVPGIRTPTKNRV